MVAKLTILGNLGGDPEMRYTPSGTAVTNFSVATNRSWKDKDGNKQKETTWFRCSIWDKRAEIVNQYFKKGMPIFVEGRLKAEPITWERKDGSWGTSYEVTVENFEFVSGTGNGSDQAQSSDAPGNEPEDIPF